MLLTNRVFLYIAASAVFLMTSFLWVPAAQAAEMKLVNDEDTNNRYYELKAKVEYLKAFITALREGELSPGPTFIVVLKEDTVSLVGTVAADPSEPKVEVCGPMKKGTIDWGDGTTENITGLGCSGNAHQFILQHTYEDSGSYKMRVTDLADRDNTHVVAVNIPD